ncbi:GDP-mannose 4,6-dehydratase [Paenibacillus guangzhouensis]|uniref:GDP-mannose 4,6-dehydratase n=1 Tax=Paenibacillus guangzhouensis TaxID=1473112 RepID=UPI0012677166|nr:GDP-mannose 4,6-dehydratase [Paenibacillus guangzhouensis]
MRIIVTGANGFVGKHLIHALVKRQHEVVAGTRRTEVSFHTPIPHCYMNLLEPDTIAEALRKFKPEAIIHLAGQTLVASSWNDPAHTVQTNVMGVIHLLQAVRQTVPRAKIVTVGSSEEYGRISEQGVPLTEDSPCLPQNPYAVSKYTAGQLALQIAKQGHLRLVHARPFNHFGPEQQTGFVVSDFISQVVEMEQGRISPIVTVGDITVQRDFLYIDDIISAYVGLIEEEVPNGIYNIASGMARRIEDILLFLSSQSMVKFEVMQDPSKYRISNVPFFVGSAEKLRTVTNWTPRTPFYHGLQQTLNWWREKSREGKK